MLNELLAYVELAGLPHAAISERSRLILTYALCGFANFGSLGIMVGGIAAMVPQRRAEIAGLGAKTMVSGPMSTLMTAAVVGLMTTACASTTAAQRRQAARAPSPPATRSRTGA